MHRIWVSGELRPGRELQLEGGEAHRLRKVMRLGRGDRVSLFNDQRLEAEGEVVDLSMGRVRLRVNRVEAVDRESPLCVRLFQALPKGDRMAWVIQKATELGVREVGVFVTRRCVVRLGAEGHEGRMNRWRRILLEAARQCGRTESPSLTGPWTLDSLCDRAARAEGLKLLLWEGEERVGLRDAMAHEVESPREVWLGVGPEGGFDGFEVRRLEAAGFRSVRMGPRILRTESAGPMAVAILQYLYGDLG